MKRFFVDVDTQVDLCFRHSSLYVPGAEDILDNCELMVHQAVKLNHLIIGSVDTNAYDSWKFKSNKNLGPNGEKPNLSAHCVKGTNGWLKMNDTMVKRSVFIPDVGFHSKDWDRLLAKKDAQAFYFEKEIHSMFTNKNADLFFEHLLQEEPVEFIVFGVATDHCVKTTSLELVDFLNSRKISGVVKVVTDAIAGRLSETIKQATEEMKSKGVKFITTQEVLSQS